MTLNTQGLMVHEDKTAWGPAKDVQLYRCIDPEWTMVALVAFARCHHLGAMAVILRDPVQPPRPSFRPIGAPANHDVLVPKLSNAVMRNNTDDVLACLRDGANVHGHIECGWGILELASYFGSWDALDVLVTKCGMTVNQRDALGGTNALHHCSLFGKSESIKMLLKLGCPVDAQDNNRSTALRSAVMYVSE